MGKIRKRKKWIAKPTEFSEALRLARTKHRGFTQKSVSEATGIPRPRLSEYETGARVPSYKTMYKLTRYRAYTRFKLRKYQMQLARGCQR